MDGVAVLVVGEVSQEEALLIALLLQTLQRKGELGAGSVARVGQGDGAMRLTSIPHRGVLPNLPPRALLT